MIQFPEADIANVARGFVARAIAVRKLSDLAPLQDSLSDGAAGLMVIDAKISPELEADWRKVYQARVGRKR